MTGRWALAPLAALYLALASCAPTPGSENSSDVAPSVVVSESESAAIDPPAEPGALAPNLASVGGRLGATWLEPVSGSDSPGHRLRFALLGEGGWSDPVSIAAGSDFFANWADIPSLVQAGDRRLYAHWLAKTAEDTYAYSVFMARSDDRGSSWQPVGKLNSDSTPTEHGFVAMVPEGDGARAFWLDGREMIHRAPMTVRSARIEDPEGVERVLDARVCECCGTDAVVTREGPLVVYRDRSENEVRDIFAVRRTAAGWTEPQAVHHDGWRIDGCPVNGPAVDAIEDRVAVAWFTAAADNSRVQIAFSDNSGESFGAPIVIDNGQVLGRVDTVLDAQGVAWVSWVSRRNQNVEILIQPFAPGGAVGEPRTVAQTTAARASGFPVLRRVRSQLFIAWVDVGEDPSSSRVRVRKLRG